MKVKASQVVPEIMIRASTKTDAATSRIERGPQDLQEMLELADIDDDVIDI